MWLLAAHGVFLRSEMTAAGCWIWPRGNSLRRTAHNWQVDNSFRRTAITDKLWCLFCQLQLTITCTSDACHVMSRWPKFTHCNIDDEYTLFKSHFGEILQHCDVLGKTKAWKNVKDFTAMICETRWFESYAHQETLSILLNLLGHLNYSSTAIVPNAIGQWHCIHFMPPKTKIYCACTENSVWISCYASKLPRKPS